ncbi:SapC family protein [Asticcacaulis sp. EMRT-3]|uniref:SapC family protein n=1 Tax=Asticcacaulis sp. EMRT-3 TaxID=3040349 RepID=UPI0024AFD52C|nr:SapC family protein [Asticcacaulis sp. EMRT-3]MDI7774948.1 SapC family protein [Asticcacaulis sp. EMRT-3]
MPHIAILNRDAHHDLRVRPHGVNQPEDRMHFVPVVVGEFGHLVTHYPILFAKDAETGAFFAGAMLGFEPGENLFAAEPPSRDVYRPLNLQRVPFFTSGDNIAIDLDSPRVGTHADGQGLFDETGGPSPYLQGIMGVFQQLVPGLERTRAFIARLLQLRLIEPVTFDLTFDDGRTITTDGLYTIDQDALRGLPDEAALALFRDGSLHLMSLMIASLKQVPQLARRKNDQLTQGFSGLSGAFG